MTYRRNLHVTVTMATKPSILDEMKKRPIIGDGSYVITLEKRGYLKAGCWTPEAVIEYPDAGVYLRCILVTLVLTFRSSPFLGVVINLFKTD